MCTRTGWRRALIGALASLTVVLGSTAYGGTGASAASGAAGAGAATVTKSSQRTASTRAAAQAGTVSAAAPVTVTRWTQTSEAGDPVGQGSSLAYTPKTASFTVSGTAEYVRISVSPSDTSFWQVEFAAPRGQKLTPGVYTRAEGAAIRTGHAPGITVFNESRGCEAPYGQFTINQIETDTSGAVTVLDASYTHRCGSATAPALRGSFKYQALPLSYSYSADAGSTFAQHAIAASSTHTGGSSTFALTPSADGVQYMVSGQREYWEMSLEPPTGERFEAGRTYPIAFSSSEDVAGVVINVSAYGCVRTVTGDLSFSQLTRDGDGAIKAFAATFTLRCDGTDPALHGTIHHYA
ncbi:hypothetical protein ACIREE_41570 [Streptomyces sp. NPDC102467]|uniref:hypothetical protein n=1 Tax=Streptomyces sp. NPDC102467 TaxID=3366179 RepID=UPI0037F587E3